VPSPDPELLDVNSELTTLGRMRGDRPAVVVLYMNTISGPLFDQADILADFADETIQDHAYATIHAFPPAEEESH
jgi:hypothetical protein